MTAGGGLGAVALETARLALRPCRPSDLAPLHALCTDPVIRRFLFDGRPQEERETRALIDASSARFRVRGLGLWLAHGKDDAALAGFAGFLGGDGEPPSLVYAIRPDLAGRGLATEAARRVLDHALRTLALPQIVADVDEPNSASVRVLEKLGFRRVRREIVSGRPLLGFALAGGAAAAEAPSA